MTDPDLPRVLFTISCFQGASTGNGGHYYSLRDMVAALGVPHQIMVIGDFSPPALKDIPDLLFARTRFTSVTGPDYSTVAGLTRPDLIHAYDLASAMFSARLSHRWKVPLVYTKPGGPPYSKLTPAFDNMIVFHEKDRANVASRPWPPKNLTLIPNRVKLDAPADPGPTPPFDPFAGMEPGALKILVISRIGQAYAEKLAQAVALRAEIAARHGPAVLCILGKIEHQGIYDGLVAEHGEDPQIRFVTDPAHTHKAARHLPLCDIAVGSGRSFMEALGHGKYVFFQASGGRLPCYAHGGSYAAGAADNFSPRVRDGRDVDAAAGFAQFLEDLQTPGAARAWALETFRRDHDIATGAQRTLDVYRGVRGHESRFSALWPPVQFRLNGLIKHHVLSRGRASGVKTATKP